MNYSEMANVRPGQPMALLAQALGAQWEIPRQDELGWVTLRGKHSRKFTARLDDEKRIGQIKFGVGFPSQSPIEGLRIGMSVAKAVAARPNMVLQASSADDDSSDCCEYLDRSEEGDILRVSFNKGLLTEIELSAPDAIYPIFRLPQADPRLTTAFDLTLAPQRQLPAANRSPEWENGWTFGLPPGIQPEHWPISTSYGHPLRHAFTLRFPEQYRVQGDELVALSIFVDDQFEELKYLGDLDLGEVASHPHSFAMEDILSTSYLAIWLTQTEFDGPLCQPPQHSLVDTPPPRWLTHGYEKCDYLSAPRGHAWVDGDDGLTLAFPIQIAVRDNDPNVGKPPRGYDRDNADSGYVPVFSDLADGLDLERFYMPPHVHHLGGTMLPVQNYPEFGPYYIEFGEDFAGFNFGTGVAQIDLVLMELDWACD